MWHQKAKGPPDGPPIFLIFVEKLNCPQSQAYQSISPVGTGLSLTDRALGVSLGTSIGNYSPLIAPQPVKLKIHRWRQRTGSSPVTGTSSSQAIWRLRRVFSFYSKTHRALTPLLLLSKSQPLALGCDLDLGMCAGKQRHLYCCDVPARCKRHVACSGFFILKIAACPSACSFLPAGSRPPGPAGGLWLLKEESTHV